MAIHLWDAFKAGRKAVIGMLHVPALPGSPRNTLAFPEIVRWVLRDAEVLTEGGMDTLMVENFGDVPFYPQRVPAHTIAFMSVLGQAIKDRVDVSLGINILRNDAESALAVATAVGADFVRVNVFTGARLTDQGLLEGRAHDLLRYRTSMGSGVRILADVDVKHSAPLAPRPLQDEVEETVQRGCADGVIVTGSGTGKHTALEDVESAVHAAGGTPVLAGSGVDASTAASILAVADGVIVGTALKREGVTTHPVDAARVREFMRAVRSR